MTALLLAVDLAPHAARAGAFDEAGRLVAHGEHPVDPIGRADGQISYRMDALWHAVGEAIHACLAPDPSLGMRVVGLAFAAFPALVLHAAGTAPLDGGADVLGHTSLAARDADRPGGHLPSLLRLKRHSPEAWSRITAMRDLADELVRRATGDDRHSLATIATRWPYNARNPDPWRHDVLEALDLSEIWGMGALAGDPVPLGQPQGRLHGDLADYLGLPPFIPVSPGLLDHHAGLFATIGRNPRRGIDRRATLIAGRTSSLLALSSTEPPAGTHPDALLPGLALHETTLPHTGAALDSVLRTHPGRPPHTALTHTTIAHEILTLLDREGPRFASQCHLAPGFPAPGFPAITTFPWGEPDHRGRLETYYAVARALALQARDAVAAQGRAPARITLAGGQARNPLMRRLYRDTLGCDLVISDHTEPVLLGIAMLAAVAAGVYPDIPAAIEVMTPAQSRLAPDPLWRRAHDAAHAISRTLATARDAIAEAGTALATLETARR